MKYICKIQKFSAGNYRILLLCALLLPTPWFFTGGEAAHYSRLVKEIWDLGHLPFFFLVACYLRLSCTPEHWPELAKGILILVCIGLIGIGIEIVQSGIPGRSASLMDILRDMAGGTAGLLTMLATREGRQWRRFITFSLMLATAVFATSRLPFLLLDSWRVSQQFPVLADFSNKDELDRWSGNAPFAHADSVSGYDTPGALWVRFTTAPYSALILHDFPEDWRGYTTLKFDSILPSGNLELNVKIYDHLHTGSGQNYANRFNSTISLQQGLNTIAIPIESIRRGPTGRELDISKIRGFSFFVSSLAQSQEMYFGKIRLE